MRSSTKPRVLALISTLVATLVLSTSACSTRDTADNEPTSPSKREASEKVDAAEGETKPASNLPAAADLLARHVEAAGGAAKIAEFESIYAESSVDTGEAKLKGTGKLWWVPGKFYVEEEIEGVGPSRAGYDGTTVWTEDPINKLRKLEGREAASFIQGEASMFPAHDWQRYYSSAETIGSVEIDGRKIWEVVLHSKDGPDMTLGLDAETGLIRHFKTKQIVQGGEIPVESVVTEYREVSGYKFAFAQRSSLAGLLELTETTTKLEINVPVDESKFSYPTSHEVVPATPSEQPPVVVPSEGAGTDAPAK